jgi:hypothetical protein
MAGTYGTLYKYEWKFYFGKYHGRRKRTWADNITTDLTEMQYEGLIWIKSAKVGSKGDGTLVSKKQEIY